MKTKSFSANVAFELAFCPMRDVRPTPAFGPRFDADYIPDLDRLSSKPYIVSNGD